MELHPARKAGESFADYRERRASENQSVNAYLKGSLCKNHRSIGKIGKALAKSLKRARIAANLAAQPHSMR